VVGEHRLAGALRTYDEDVLPVRWDSDLVSLLVRSEQHVMSRKFRLA